MMLLTLGGVAAVTGRPERASSANFFEEPAPPGDVAMVQTIKRNTPAIFPCNVEQRKSDIKRQNTIRSMTADAFRSKNLDVHEEVHCIADGFQSLLSKNLKVRIYKTVILPVVLYGCETWTLTLRQEQRLRVFENKVLRKIFRAKKDEVGEEWGKLHILYSSPDIIRNIKSRRLRWARHVARMGESRNSYRVLVGRPEGKRPLGRPRRIWEDNIKMDLREVGYDDRDWINLSQDRDR
ncbi:hypothetical protein ANN_25185 [Periplaneta americana]|uniref:Uncharacterized protein n=1 Tax=Periplaneta americana TaxID=6978 RepID=A0ABQ8S0S8_PERAM|nr:hypothetical protein ANN_25185 [Periplaneta americana]